MWSVADANPLRKRVNISGVAGKSKEDFLEEKRKEREERAQIKKREKSGQTIQRWFRGYQARKLMRPLLKELIQDNLYQINQHSRALTTAVHPLDIAQTVRKLTSQISIAMKCFKLADINSMLSQFGEIFKTPEILTLCRDQLKSIFGILINLDHKAGMDFVLAVGDISSCVSNHSKFIDATLNIVKEHKQTGQALLRLYPVVLLVLLMERPLHLPDWGKLLDVFIQSLDKLIAVRITDPNYEKNLNYIIAVTFARRQHLHIIEKYLWNNTRLLHCDSDVLPLLTDQKDSLLCESPSIFISCLPELAIESRDRSVQKAAVGNSSLRHKLSLEIVSLLRLSNTTFSDDTTLSTFPEGASSFCQVISQSEFEAAKLYAFCLVYSTQLRIMNFKDLSNPSINTLTFAQTQSLAITMNLIARDFLVNQHQYRSMPIFFKLSQAVSTLVRLLYDKRKFLDLESERYWLLAALEVPANLNTAELETVLKDYEKRPEEDHYDAYAQLLSYKSTAERVAFTLLFLPHLIEFKSRVKIFETLVTRQREHYESRGLRQAFSPSHHKIRRFSLLKDGFKLFDLAQLQDIIRVKFISAHGETEAGIDGGGLFKEFLHLWIKDVVNPNLGLFTELENGHLTPNRNAMHAFSVAINTLNDQPEVVEISDSSEEEPEFRRNQMDVDSDSSSDEDIEMTHDHSAEQQQDVEEIGELPFLENLIGRRRGRSSNRSSQLERPLTVPGLFYAAGRSIGKSLLEMILNETRFSEIFLNRVLGKPASVDELLDIDPILHKNLQYLQECPDASELGLFFSVMVPDETGTMVERNLIPDGKNIPVTNDNRTEYLYMMAMFKCVAEMRKPANAFASGISSVVNLAYLKMFSSHELQLLLSGEEQKIFDAEDLRKNTVYGGGFSADSETIKLFWDVVTKEFTYEDQSALLVFITSSPRAPLLGFKMLNPKICIYKVSEVERLPTASTCINLLKLPDYKDKRILKEKLLQSIHAQAAFDLS